MPEVVSEHERKAWCALRHPSFRDWCPLHQNVPFAPHLHAFREGGSCIRTLALDSRDVSSSKSALLSISVGGTNQIFFVSSRPLNAYILSRVAAARKYGTSPSCLSVGPNWPFARVRAMTEHAVTLVGLRSLFVRSKRPILVGSTTVAAP